MSKSETSSVRSRGTRSAASKSTRSAVTAGSRSVASAGASSVATTIDIQSLRSALTSEGREEDISDEEDDGTGKVDLEMLVDVSKHIAGVAESRKTKTSMRMELLKERIVSDRGKADRAQRLQSLQMPHRHICDMVATYLNVETNAVLDGVADAKSHVDLLESFLTAGGRQAILFYYQDGPAYEIESGRYNATIPRDTVFKRIFVTDGSSLPLTDQAIVAYKNNSLKDIDLRNINDDVFFAQLDMKEMNGNSVAIVSYLISKLLAPSVNSTKEWGDLSKTGAGLQTKKDFLGDFEFFTNFLEKARIDLDETVIFTIDEELYNRISTPSKIKDVIRDADVRLNVETIVRVWQKQIERVLTQFQQLRRENEFVGPFVEVEYWRRQLAKFVSIVEFTKSQECIMYVQYLNQIRSKLVKIWKKQDCAVTNARNQCQDNVKFLYALEKYYEPLYRYDPTKIPEYIPSLLYTIRMVFTTSRYYNNTASVTAILVKVSNQMINMSRSYINCNGTKTIWVQPKKDVLHKIKVCLDLYFKYYQCFKLTQQKMEEAGEPPFDCSEMYVFGKFETFKQRLEKV
ncbi:hypothetical protein ILUMI_17566 [Ignelater luminosus]|uniref:Dynein heavy chain tail domain-containing protein n=1 Tax=Ignelater luminosus TaxID=2038154 RepID=A0A8K0CQT2_IGNLU|nr:hypothetical protein ILUMI_17566 [Ignelater luminosus]